MDRKITKKKELESEGTEQGFQGTKVELEKKED